jgi:hypothetical protein
MYSKIRKAGEKSVYTFLISLFNFFSHRLVPSVVFK